MSRDVIITPASGLMEFKNSGNTLGQIELSTANVFSITGNISLGDASTDVYIGDGINNVDLLFEQAGAISGTTGVTVTLGTAGSFLSFGANITSGANISGNVVAGNVIASGLVSLSSVTKTGSNGVGNIGSSTSTFDTVFAKATSAQYADVAEYYIADQVYAPGTVLEFGGNNEVRETTQSHTTAIAGVVSSNPAVIMNSSLRHDNRVIIALLGRVPCCVQGPVGRGDLLVAGSTPGTAVRLDPAQYQPGCVIGKALEDCESDVLKTIEVVVGRI